MLSILNLYISHLMKTSICFLHRIKMFDQGILPSSTGDINTILIFKNPPKFWITTYICPQKSRMSGVACIVLQVRKYVSNYVSHQREDTSYHRTTGRYSLKMIPHLPLFLCRIHPLQHPLPLPSSYCLFVSLPLKLFFLINENYFIIL